MSDTAWYDVAADWQVSPGNSIPVRIGEREIVLCNASGTLHALENRCTHMGAPLDGGRITDTGIIVCPFHKARFNLADGTAVSGKYDTIPTYPVKVEDGRVLVQA